MAQFAGAVPDEIKSALPLTEAGFAIIDGTASGYDDTKVDVVAVPIPGAHPVHTWCRDPLPDNYGLPSRPSSPANNTISEPSGGVILSPTIDRRLSRQTIWLTDGLKRRVKEARIVLYQHRYLNDYEGLDVLAEDLLKNLERLRQSLPENRPLHFVGHGVGGLVIKAALVKANRDEKYRNLSAICYGITFFATPHRGSSYLASNDRAERVKSLLGLRHPLSKKLRSEINIRGKELLSLNSDFTAIASDFRIWSFYETLGSKISTYEDDVPEIHPLVSLKSSLLGSRREAVFSLSSDHADCASFGEHNLRTLDTYLRDLSYWVEKSVKLSQRFDHVPLRHSDPLRLGHHVKITLTVFFENQGSAYTGSLRHYFSRHSLNDFLENGLQKCLETRPTPSRVNPARTLSEPTDIFRDIRQVNHGDDHIDDEDHMNDEDGPEADLDATQPLEFRKNKHLWIHLPFTNPCWVEQILQHVAKTYDVKRSMIYNYDSWTGRFVFGRNPSQPSYIRPTCGCLAPESQDVPSSTGTFYLYLPYLNFDTYHSMLRRRYHLQQRIKHGRVFPVPRAVAEEESLEFKVNWAFLEHDPPINMRRSLDQFGYPALRDTTVQDDDQMLYKLTKEQRDSISSEHPAWTPFLQENGSGFESQDSLSTIAPPSLGTVPNGKVLMVDQLWLWAIGPNILTTFFPQRETNPAEGTLSGQGNLRHSVVSELSGDLAGKCENSFDLAALVASHAVTVLLDRTLHPDLDVFTVFEEALEVLVSNKIDFLKRLRAQSTQGGVYSSLADTIHTEIPESETLKKQRQRERELQIATEFTRENTSALIELADMDDELTTLKELFDEQRRVLENMVAIYDRPEMQTLTRNGRVYLQEALKRLDQYTRETDDMVARIGATRDDYERVLEMVQRQAQVDDARMQTELASSQNLSVTIFTAFTVIFLPLSFFTGLFGMNTAEWDDNFPSLAFIGAVALPASLVLIIVSLVAALSESAQEALRRLFHAAGEAFRGWFVASPVGVRRSLAAAAQSKTDSMIDEVNDFWDRQLAKTRRRRPV